MTHSFFSDLDSAEDLPSTSRSENKRGFFTDLPESKKVSDWEKFQVAPAEFGIKGASTIKSLPRSVSGILKYGSEALARKGREQAEKEGKKITPEEAQMTQFFVDVLGKPEEWLKKLGLPSYEEALESTREKVRKSEEIPEHDLTALEKGFGTAGDIAAGSLITPGGSFGNAARTGLTGLAALGAGGIAALEGEEGAQLGGAIGLPVIVDAISRIKSGKLMPSSKELKDLYKQGKSFGLSEKQLAPIIQSEKRQSFLGTFSARTQRAKKAIQSSESALGKIYDEIKESPGAQVLANPKQTRELTQSLSDVADEMRRSKFRSADKDAAILKIEHTINEIENAGINSGDIIETLVDINRSINWNAVGSKGKKYLSQIKEPFRKTFSQIDQNGWKKFAPVNKMYSKLQNTAYHIEPKTKKLWLKEGKIGSAASSLVGFVLGGPVGAIKGFATKSAMQLLATEMLINPRLNSLMNKTMASLKQANNRASLIKSIRNFENGLKEFPEIYKEFDFTNYED